MRQLSANVAPLLIAGTAEMILLVRIYDKNNTVIFTSTTFYEDVTLSNGYVYAANGLIVGADPQQLSTTVDREQYKISIADPSFLQGPLLEAGLTGARLEVRLGFINPATGLPFTAETDTFILYRGRIDNAGYKISTEEYGESILQISGASPLLSLDTKRGLLLSKDAARQRNSNDSCCDQIYEGSSAITLKWGKA